MKIENKVGLKLVYQISDMDASDEYVFEIKENLPNLTYEIITNFQKALICTCSPNTLEKAKHLFTLHQGNMFDKDVDFTLPPFIVSKEIYQSMLNKKNCEIIFGDNEHFESISNVQDIKCNVILDGKSIIIAALHGTISTKNDNHEQYEEITIIDNSNFPIVLKIIDGFENIIELKEIRYKKDK